MKGRRHIFATTILAMSLAFGWAPNAHAQLDPGMYLIYQNGREVGQIFVSARGPEGRYVEHWFVSNEYRYPSQSRGGSMDFRPSPTSYQSADEFLAKASWGTGYRYIRVDANESTTRPDAGSATNEVAVAGCAIRRAR